MRSYVLSTTQDMNLLAESLAVAQDGALLLPDRHGYIWRASQTGSGQWIKDSSPLAYLGPGRPLGIRADQDGDVLVCNAGTVRVCRERLRSHSVSTCTVCTACVIIDSVPYMSLVGS